MNFDAHGSLEIEADALQQIVKCIGLVAEQVDTPTYFTEFIRISQVGTGVVPAEAERKVHIMATDGFRMHLVEGEFKVQFHDAEHTWFPIPAKWLIENASILGPGTVRFVCQRRTTHWKLLVVDGATPPLTSVLEFDTDALTWPVNMQRLFQGNVEEGKVVGFNVDYLSDAFKALKIWRGTVPDGRVLPMAVEALSDKTFSRFSMKNEHGVLVTIVMPVLMDPDDRPTHTEDGPPYDDD